MVRARGGEEASDWKREVVVSAAGIKEEDADGWRGSYISLTFSSGWDWTGVN